MAEEIQVLVLDDDPNWVKLLEENIKRIQGITAVVNGYTQVADCLAAVREQEFTLCLIDILLGQDDGIDIVKQIKKIRPDAYIALCTALDQSLDLDDKALDAGASTIIYKDYYLQRSLARSVQAAMKATAAQA